MKFEWKLMLYFCFVRPESKASSSSLILPSPLPTPKRKKLKTSTGALKRSADDAGLDASADADDDIILESSAPSTSNKKAKLNGSDHLNSNGKGRAFPNVNMASPSKKRRLEDEGLLMLEHPDENVDDEPELIDIGD